MFIHCNQLDQQKQCIHCNPFWTNPNGLGCTVYSEIPMISPNSLYNESVRPSVCRLLSMWDNTGWKQSPSLFPWPVSADPIYFVLECRNLQGHFSSFGVVFLSKLQCYSCQLYSYLFYIMFYYCLCRHIVVGGKKISFDLILNWFCMKLATSQQEMSNETYIFVAKTFV